MRKTTKLAFLALMVAALALAVGGPSMAFHEATELKCMACHTMHASENGSNVNVNPGNGFNAAPAGGVTDGGNLFLLVQSNETDLCLACHWEGGSAASFTDLSGDPAPWVMSVGGSPTYALPGGDYYTSNQTVGGVLGARGHNPGTTNGTAFGIIAQDGVLGLTPPGGTLVPPNLTKWDCVSCHAPHQNDSGGAYGTANPNFRLLWSNPDGFGGLGVTFGAVEGTLSDPATHLHTPEADDNHSGYTGSVSQWCGICHGNYHNDGASNTIHPSGRLLPGYMVTAYNTNPSPAPALPYSYLVPIEDPGASTGDFSAGANSRVMCLSCHRAHAAATSTALPAANVNTNNMTRWDMTQPSGSGTGCNKCHDKGE